MARLKDGTWGPVYESMVYEGRDREDDQDRDDN
jgi:hypothetical protein